MACGDKMIPETIYDLCCHGSTVSLELAANSSAMPREIIRRLFPRANREGGEKGEKKTAERVQDKSHDLQQAYQCGTWGSQRPSDLFLQVYGAIRSIPHALIDSLHMVADISRRVVYTCRKSRGRDHISSPYWQFWRGSVDHHWHLVRYLSSYGELHCSR